MDNNNHGLIFSGDILVRNLDIPDSQFYRLFNITKLEFAPDVGSVQRVSREKNKAGAAIDEVRKKKPTAMNVSGDTFNKPNFAMVLGGEASNLTEASEAVTGEAHKVGNGIIDLAKEGVDASTVKITVGSGVVDKSTYWVIENLGMIEPLDGFPVIDTELKIDYSTKASEGYSILADKLSGFNFELKGDGINEVTGEEIRIYVPKASLSSDGAIDFFSEDFNSFNMSGSALYSNKIKSTYKTDVIKYV